MTALRPFAVQPWFPDTSLVIMPNHPAMPSVEHALTALNVGTTVVTIRPRPAMCATDQPGSPELIGVFRDGLLAEAGTAPALIAANGLYAHLRQAWQTGATA